MFFHAAATTCKKHFNDGAVACSGFIHLTFFFHPGNMSENILIYNRVLQQNSDWTYKQQQQHNTKKIHVTRDKCINVHVEDESSTICWVLLSFTLENGGFRVFLCSPLQSWAWGGRGWWNYFIQRDETHLFHLDLLLYLNKGQGWVHFVH